MEHKFNDFLLQKNVKKPWTTNETEEETLFFVAPIIGNWFYAARFQKARNASWVFLVSEFKTTVYSTDWKHPWKAYGVHKLNVVSVITGVIPVASRIFLHVLFYTFLNYLENPFYVNVCEKLLQFLYRETVKCQVVLCSYFHRDGIETLVQCSVIAFLRRDWVFFV